MDVKALGQLRKGDSEKYLGVIDQLRELGIGEDLSLPQLVVVGDQSSGKSSLLEGLTGLCFPVASDLCTRYATQIVLRRAPESEKGVTISIIPGPSSMKDASTKSHLENFQRSMEEASFDNDELSKILNEASSHMGLPSVGSTNLEDYEKRFSDDVLKIEMKGPAYQHLSVVDVPGLFHNPTIFQTEEDLQTIRQLIENYISVQRTIILAVMDACHNLAQQEVFKMARSVDPRGDRIVGIITKCDVVQAGDEAKVIAISQNKIETLQHGWFVVRNRSPKEVEQQISREQRNIRERDFFLTNPWNKIHDDRKGIPALTTFLAQLLFEHIRKEFPGLLGEIKGKCERIKSEIEGMGPCRRSTWEQRQYLTHIASNYQKQASNSLVGNYDPKSGPEDPLKLRMHIRELSDKFQEELTTDGHARAFRNIDDTLDTSYACHIIKKDRSKNEVDAAIEETYNSEDQGENDDIYDWIKSTYLQSRGCELPGTVNPAIIETLFRQQTANWPTVAHNYLTSVKITIDSFLEASVAKLVGDANVKDQLQGKLSRIFEEAMRKASVTLDQLLEDERGGILQTVNHDFADNLNAAREDRIKARLKALNISNDDNEQCNVNLNALMETVHLSNEKQAVIDIHDILKAYYQVAIKRFMDNVVIAVVERSFLGTEGCVKYFDAEFVGQLSDDDLSSIAGESYSTTKTRQELVEKLERFEEALQIARGLVRW